MSQKDLARRTSLKIYFDNVDISDDVNKDMLSFTYEDNESDEADDIQIRIEDREDVWLTKWLNDAVQAALERPESSSGSSGSTYKVTAAAGLNVRSGPGTKHKKLGTLSYGATVKVSSISDGWAKVTYSGKTAYVSATYITVVATSTGTAGSWAIGDEVIVNGRPQSNSYGGSPGAMLANYRGKITHLNLKSGVPYPLHVDQKGWFAVGEVARVGAPGTTGKKSGTKGLNIRAVIVQQNWNGDGVDRTLDTGDFELDDIGASGPPSAITIKGTSIPYISTIRQTKKSKAWEKYSLTRIHAEIAAANGMASMYESGLNPTYDRVEQTSESDIAFLRELCKNAGLALKVTSNCIVIFDETRYESMPVIRTVIKGDGTYLRYDLRTGTADTQYSACRVLYRNPKTGKVIKYTYRPDETDEKGPVLEVREKVGSAAEAQMLAMKRLRQKNKFERSVSFTFPGGFEYAAGKTLALSGFGYFDGVYIIKQAAHNVSASGYTVSVTLRRTLRGY